LSSREWTGHTRRKTGGPSGDGTGRRTPSAGTSRKRSGLYFITWRLLP
jgi:hypothetical protein